MEKSSFEYTQEFFDMWMKNYQSTFGKLAQVPAFGPIREKQEKIMKGFPIYVNLYNTWIESNINFQTVFTEAMRKTYDKTITETKGEISPEKYKDFYKIVIDTYSETLKEFMKSGHYTSDMGKLMSHFMDFQKYNKDMIEENILKPCNLPTKTDIDEINKDLYTLRKALKDLDKKTNEISKTADERGQKVLDNLDNTYSEISKTIDEIHKKIIQLDLDEKMAETSKKIKTEIQLDLDKKMAEMSKKTKTEIQSDIDKKIAEMSKKTKAEIQTNLDNKINELSKKIDEQKSPVP